MRPGQKNITIINNVAWPPHPFSGQKKMWNNCCFVFSIISAVSANHRRVLLCSDICLAFPPQNSPFNHLLFHGKSCFWDLETGLNSFRQQLQLDADKWALCKEEGGPEIAVRSLPKCISATGFSRMSSAAGVGGNGETRFPRKIERSNCQTSPSSFMINRTSNSASPQNLSLVKTSRSWISKKKHR